MGFSLDDRISSTFHFALRGEEVAASLLDNDADDDDEDAIVVVCSGCYLGLCVVAKLRDK